jgi:two-component system KDP operon response regulator KdpE
MISASEKLILVVDDESRIVRFVRMNLELEGYQVAAAATGMEALEKVRDDIPDLVLLDVMMPEMDGYEVCRRIRELTTVPILLFTGKATGTEDVVRGFSVGADDYIIKPFRPSELVSRLYARLRSSNETKASGHTYLSPDASIMLNVDRRELVIRGQSTYLPPKEFKLLQLLVRHPGQVFSANAILAQVWGPERIGEPDLVKQCVYRLRKKIEPDPTAPKYIHAVRGEGYYFEISED